MNPHAGVGFMLMLISAVQMLVNLAEADTVLLVKTGKKKPQ